MLQALGVALGPFADPRGPPGAVRHLGEELLATKGVLHGEITFTSGEGAFNRWGGEHHHS